ncbi:WXG100 family type VII secretion target [Lentzea atacamensis]|uniref:ESAT-6-like protein n=1 Tax=Lentzea atacamensis TaxID=531938 RepID=A0ABX9EDP0_9PSEU|nr:WXG100 family type VII secretion target [Lentzea atacamensis]RAS68763.1 WXG100 family type VII secretion target [Lentzea atacamensis]
MIKVTFAEVAAAAATITSSSKSIDDLNDQLKAQVDKTLAGWMGASGEGYQAAQKKWADSAADLNAVLAAIGTAVQQASEAYAQAEQSNAARW